MTGSIALDVVIGLVFIYLLYSLLATIIQEIIANILGLRARNLKHALSRMLKDGPARQTNIISRGWSDIHHNYKRNFTKDNESLLESFYKQPIVTQLASGNYFSKPSYMSEVDFSKNLIALLKSKGESFLENELKKEDEDVEKLREYLKNLDGKKDHELSRILNETISQKEKKALENNDYQEWADIDKIWAALSSGNLKIDSGTKQHLITLLEESQGDMARFRGNLESWFNHTMERASGWYKKSIQFTLLIIGFCMAMIFDANTIEITKLLSKDKEAREALVTMAVNYVEENPEIMAYLKRQDSLKNESTGESNAVSEISNDSSGIYDEAFTSKVEELLEVKADLETDIESAHNILGFRPVDNLPVQLKTNILNLKPTERIVDSCKGKFYIVDFPNSLLANKTYAYYELKEQDVEEETIMYADFNYLGYLYDNFWQNFWGYLITALAISLGAPFWFDLLNKLIRLRGSLQNQSISNSNTDKTTGGVQTVNQRVG